MRTCDGRGTCSRSHRPHQLLHGIQPSSGRFFTIVAERYPRKLCCRLVAAYAAAIAHFSEDHILNDLFSGMCDGHRSYLAPHDQEKVRCGNILALLDFRLSMLCILTCAGNDRESKNESIMKVGVFPECAIDPAHDLDCNRFLPRRHTLEKAYCFPGDPATPRSVTESRLQRSRHARFQSAVRSEKPNGSSYAELRRARYVQPITSSPPAPTWHPAFIGSVLYHCC